MGKGSGSCAERGAITVLPAYADTRRHIPIQIDDFSRDDLRARIILPNGEIVIAFSYRECPGDHKGFKMLAHCASDGTHAFYQQSYYNRYTPAPNSIQTAYPINLLEDVVFPHLPAFVSAVEQLVGEDVQYKIDLIQYVATTQYCDDRIEYSLSRNQSDGLWQIDVNTIFDGNIHLVEGYETRQDAIGAINYRMSFFDAVDDDTI